MQETGRFDQVEILGRYTRAVKLCTEYVLLTLLLHSLATSDRLFQGGKLYTIA